MPTGALEKYSSEFWQEKYWKVCSQMTEMQKKLSDKISAFDHRIFLARDLAELNLWQAGRISELEFYLSCIHVKGDSVVVDYQTLKKRIRFIKSEGIPEGLSSSKYLRK